MSRLYVAGRKIGALPVLRKLLLVLLVIFAVFIFINANAAVKSDNVAAEAVERASLQP